MPIISPSEDTRADIVLAYVGSVVPDQPEFHSPAFSRAGNMRQTNVLDALKNAGLPPSLILSQQPMRAFPNSRTIMSAPGRVVLPSNLGVNLLPFLNLPILRPLTVGIFVLINLIRWGWQQRAAQQKVVYTFNLTEPMGLFTLLAARLIGAKAVVSVNDVNVPGEAVPATLFHRFDFWLQKKLIPHFDGLVVVNTRIVEDMAPDVPFVHVAGGVSEEILRRSFDHRGEPDAPFTIVSTGSLSEHNGFEDLLQAFSLLRGNSYRLRIAGKGELESRIRQSAETDPRIEYCGYLGFIDVLALYDTADVLINMRLTQRVKTHYYFPSKMFEYLASGVPVITTCVGQIEEEYAERAFFLKDESPEGLARLIEQVASMEPEIRKQKGRMAREYIQAHGTWEAQGCRIVNFIDDLMRHSYYGER